MVKTQFPVVGRRRRRGGLLLAAAAALAFTACAPRTVVVQVKMPPDLDPSVFKKVAVLPFDGDGDADVGLRTAKSVREAMEEKGGFLVEAGETVEAAVDRRDVFDPASRDQALALGKELGVDLVVIGQAHFFNRTYSDEGYVGNELYTAEHENAPFIDYGPSLATRNMDVKLKYTLEVTVKAYDVKSGRLIRRREFEKTTTEAYKSSEVARASRKEQEIFDGLLEGVVEDFVYTLETHEVAAEREVETI